MNLNNEIAAMRILIDQRMDGLMIANAPFEKSEISQVLLPLLDFTKSIVELDLKLVQPVMAKPKRVPNIFDDDFEDSDLEDDEDDDDDTDLEEWG